MLMRVLVTMMVMVAAGRAWNSLPSLITASTSPTAFWHELHCIHSTAVPTTSRSYEKCPCNCLLIITSYTSLHHYISIAAVFIDMHGAIDLLNFKYGNVAKTRCARKYAVWQCFVRQFDF